VLDSAGHTVRTLLASSRRGGGSAVTNWDGRDDQGHIVPEGAYSLQIVAQAPGLPPLQRGVGVTIDAVSLHGTVQIRAILAGQPAARVIVIAYKSSTGAYVTQAVTDSNGVTRLSLAAGSYDLLAQTARGASAGASGIVVAQRATQQRTLVLTAPVVGPASTASPTPTAGVNPSTTPTPATPTSTATPPIATQTGTPAPSISPSATAMPSVTASVVPGQGTLALSVVLAPGKPAADATIRVLQGTKVVAEVPADGAGKANLPLPAGQYTVTASLEAATRSLAVTVSGGASTAQVIDLQAGILQLQIQQANGQPAAYTSIYFLSGTKEVYDIGTGSSGQAQVILPAGSYTIQAGLAPHVLTATVQVTAGATISRTLKLS
jgi:flagellar hook assembly protein FlgD